MLSGEIHGHNRGSEVQEVVDSVVEHCCLCVAKSAICDAQCTLHTPERCWDTHGTDTHDIVKQYLINSQILHPEDYVVQVLSLYSYICA